MNFDKDQEVYFKHRVHCWTRGKVIGDSVDKKGNKLIEVQPLENGMEATLVEVQDVYAVKEEDDLGSEDLLEIVDLNEATLLLTLEKRFFVDDIYTNLSDIVISINPFKWGIPWVQENMMDKYISQEDGLRPSIWKVADSAYRDMIDTKMNHSILISGESGAGKTEACKSSIKYINKLSCSSTVDPEIFKKADQIAYKIQQSSPILEAFGNAKTINNDNSSRFGKFIKLQFDSQGVIRGAAIENYLLEKSRLISPGPDERSYHIFYQIFTDSALIKKLKLTKAEDYQYINAGNCTVVDTIDDATEFKDVLEAFKTLNFSESEVDNIFKVIASVLHLQNVKFQEVDEKAQVVNKDVLNLVAELLSVDYAKLEKGLTTKTISVMGNPIVSDISVEKANDARDALLKHIYANTFNWIVFKINQQINTKSYDLFIGLLDIFGFELFEVNSFEQFCINFANESLQNHYNNFNFKRDMQECRDEGIDVTSVTFADNTPCIELIKGGKSKHGILHVLDDNCAFPRATDHSFLDAIVKKFLEADHFKKNKSKRDEFLIRHYAAEVPYNINNWLEKNKDILKPDLLSMMQKSKNPWFQKLIPEPIKIRGKPLTVSGQFKSQLDKLMKTVNSTSPHWIRCIKSHSNKKPNSFHRSEVMKQLISSGVLETIRMRREGFAVRMPLQLFWKKFKILIAETHSTDYKESCKKILEKAKIKTEEGQVGKTKVFLRSHIYPHLNECRKDALLSSVKLLQRYARMKFSKVKVDEILWEKYREEREAEERKKAEEERKRKEEEERIRKEKEEEERIRREEEARKFAELERIRIQKEKEEKLRQERLEQERREREAREEARRIELEKRAKARREREKKLREERERKERIRLEKIEAERKEQDRLEAERQRVLEEAKKKRLEEERKQREILEKKRFARLRRERERQERLDRERAELLAARRRQEEQIREKKRLEAEKLREEKILRRRELQMLRQEEEELKRAEQERYQAVRDKVLEQQRNLFAEQLYRERHHSQLLLAKRQQEKLQFQKRQLAAQRRAKKKLEKERKRKQEFQSYVKKIAEHEKKVIYETQELWRDREEEILHNSSLLEEYSPPRLSSSHKNSSRKKKIIDKGVFSDQLALGLSFQLRNRRKSSS